MSKKHNNWVVKFASSERKTIPAKQTEEEAQEFIFIHSKVKNLAYEKNVTLHYRDSISDIWQDCPAQFERAINEREEIWSQVPEFKGEYIEYAIRYEVGGNTYWDNNNGKNYRTYKDGKTIK